jgi:riboflavin synthase
MLSIFLPERVLRTSGSFVFCPLPEKEPMFTGLIETTGQITRIQREGGAARLVIAAPSLAASLAIGESVAVDGACLAVEHTSESEFTVYASEETLTRTTLRSATSGRRVNLERALRLGDRLGGHLVAGHVDATGTLEGLEARDEGWWLRVAAPEEILAFCVSKGSIAVDGISLTLVDVSSEGFAVAVIPQTYRDTTLHGKRAGDALNLESDMIGKYVAKMVGAYSATERPEEKNRRMLDLLRRSGYTA